VPGGAQRAHVGLDDPELAARREAVELLRDGPHDLHLDVARRRATAGGLDRHALAGHRLPALRHVTGHVGHRRPAQPGGDVVPAEAPPRRMRGRVVAITAEVGDVDAAHEGDLVVDHDDLLVVAVHRALVGVQRRLDARPTHELLARLSHRGPPRREQRHRCAGPQQHTNLNQLGRLTQQLAQQHARLGAGESELRRDAPPGEQHAPARAADRLLERREVCGAVDQHLDGVASSRRRIPRGPELPIVRRRALRATAEPAQPARVMRVRHAFDHIAYGAIGG